jgi:hypothetical protein
LKLPNPACALFPVEAPSVRAHGPLHPQQREFDPGPVVGLLGQPDALRDRHQ